MKLTEEEPILNNLGFLLKAGLLGVKIIRFTLDKNFSIKTHRRKTSALLEFAEGITEEEEEPNSRYSILHNINYRVIIFGRGFVIHH